MLKITSFSRFFLSLTRNTACIRRSYFSNNHVCKGNDNRNVNDSNDDNGVKKPFYRWIKLKQDIEELTSQKKYNEACELFQSIRKKQGIKPAPFIFACIGKTLYAMKNDKVSPDINSFNTLVDLVSVTKGPEEALGILDTMELHKIKPDTTTFTNLMDGMIYFHRSTKLVSRLIHLMKAEKVNPDIETFNPLLRFYSEQGESGMISNLFTVLIKLDIPPNPRTAAIIYKYFDKEPQVCKEFQELLAHFNVIISLDSLPNIDFPGEDYYEHFPKPNFDKDGIPIVPESFKNYKDRHVPREDGTFPWEPAGNARYYKPRQWRDPPLKTIKDVNIWMNKNRYKEGLNLFQLFDFDALRKEVGQRYNLDEAIKIWNDKKPGGSNDPVTAMKNIMEKAAEDPKMRKQWEEITKKLKEDDPDFKIVKDGPTIPGYESFQNETIFAKPKNSSSRVVEDDDMLFEHTDLSKFMSRKDVEEFKDTWKNFFSKGSSNVDDSKKEELYNRWMYGTRKKPEGNPLDEIGEKVPTSEDQKDPKYWEQKFAERDRQMREESEKINEILKTLRMFNQKD